MGRILTHSLLSESGGLVEAGTSGRPAGLLAAVAAGREPPGGGRTGPAATGWAGGEELRAREGERAGSNAAPLGGPDGGGFRRRGEALVSAGGGVATAPHEWTGCTNSGTARRQTPGLRV